MIRKNVIRAFAVASAAIAVSAIFIGSTPDSSETQVESMPTCRFYRWCI
jgi:hypothetical protein